MKKNCVCLVLIPQGRERKKSIRGIKQPFKIDTKFFKTPNRLNFPKSKTKNKVFLHVR